MREPSYLVKLDVGGGVFAYVFCSEWKMFPTDRLKSSGANDLQTLYNNSPKAVGVAILPGIPPLGPTGAAENSVDWQTYASRIQVGP